MIEWGISFREIETEWTDEEFNLMMHGWMLRKHIEQEEMDSDPTPEKKKLPVVSPRQLGFKITKHVIGAPNGN